MKAPKPRRGMPSPELGEEEFRKRFLSQFADPAFDRSKANSPASPAPRGKAIRKAAKVPRPAKPAKATQTPITTSPSTG